MSKLDWMAWQEGITDCEGMPLLIDEPVTEYEPLYIKTPNYKSLSRYKIQDKQMISIANPSECQDFSHLIGSHIFIDSQEYTVLGVERFAHNPPWRKNEPIGLWVI